MTFTDSDKILQWIIQSLARRACEEFLTSSLEGTISTSFYVIILYTECYDYTLSLSMGIRVEPKPLLLHKVVLHPKDIDRLKCTALNFVLTLG